METPRGSHVVDVRGRWTTLAIGVALLLSGAASPAAAQGPSAAGYDETGNVLPPATDRNRPPPPPAPAPAPVPAATPVPPPGPEPTRGASDGVPEGDTAAGRSDPADRPVAVSPDSDEPAPAAQARAADGSTLPFTGADALLAGLGGVILIALGLVLRRNTQAVR